MSEDPLFGGVNIDKIIDRVSEQSSVRGRRLRSASKGDPDVYAKARDLGLEAGLTPDTVIGQEDVIGERNRDRELDRWVENDAHPKMTQWLLSDQENARLAHDQVQQLEQLEETASFYGETETPPDPTDPEPGAIENFLRAIPRHYEQGSIQRQVSQIDTNEVLANLGFQDYPSYDDLSRRTSLLGTLSELEMLNRQAEFGRGSKLALEIPKQIPNLLGGTGKRFAAQFTVQGGLAVTAAGLRRIPVVGVAAGGVSLAQKSGVISRGVGVLATVVDTAEQEIGGMYRESIETIPPTPDFPADDPFRNYTVLIMGTLAGSAEALGQFGVSRGFANTVSFNKAVREQFRRLMSDGVKHPALRQWAKGTLGEGGTEMIQETFAVVAIEWQKALAGSATVDEALGKFASLENLARMFGEHQGRVGEAGLTGLVVGGTFTAASTSFGVAAENFSDRRRTQRATHAASFLTDIDLAVDELQSLKERSPEKLREAIEASAAGGGVDTVMIPADELNFMAQDQEIDIDDLFDGMPETVRESYDRGLENGGDVAIPLGFYVTNVMKTEAHEKLTPHIRINEDDHTATEALAVQAEADVRIEATAARATAEIEQGAQQDRQVDFIAAQLAREILEASPTVLNAEGQTVPLSRREAQASAFINAKMIVNLADRFGIPVQELEQRVGRLVVTGFRGEPNASNVLLQPEDGDVIDLAARRKDASEQKERILDEIRKQVKEVIEEAQQEATAEQVSQMDPDSVHSIGDRFLGGKPAGNSKGHLEGNVRLEITGYDRVDDNGTVHYTVTQHWPDGTTSETRLTNENFEFATKLGGLEVVPSDQPATAPVTDSNELFQPVEDPALEQLLAEYEVVAPENPTPEQIQDTNAAVEVAEILWEAGVFQNDYAIALRSRDVGLIEEALESIGDRRTWAEILEEHEGETEADTFSVADSADFFDIAIQDKGLTDDINEAGYILPDGGLLDFSGKRNGGPPGQRAEDHRQIVSPAGVEGTDAMIAFQRLGAIRIDAASNFIDMETRPTSTQLRVLEQLFDSGEPVNIDLVDFESPKTKETGERSTSFVAHSPEALRRRVLEFYRGVDVERNAEFFQPDEEGTPATPPPRGFFAPTEGGQANTIGLGEGANLSTFLHEASGHYVINVLGALAQDPNAPQQIVDDYAALLKFAGVEQGQAIVDTRELEPALLALKLAREAKDTKAIAAARKRVTHANRHAEKLARAMEQYLREGKAPTSELKRAFQQFAAWLTDLYRDLARLTGRALPADVVEVFDRLVATDEEIRQAKAEHKLGPMLTEKPEWMTAKEWEVYSAAAVQEEQLANERLLRIQARDRKRAKKEAAFSGERELMTSLVEEELRQSPIHQARQWLADGTWIGTGDAPTVQPGKLDQAEILQEFGDRVLRSLPKHRQGVLAGKRTGGANHWEVARAFGLSTHELISGLQETPVFSEAVEQRVNEDLASMEPTDDTTQQQAVDALHGEPAANGVVRDIGWLKKQTAARRAVRAAAERQVAEQGALTAEERLSEVTAAQDALDAAQKAGLEARESGSAEEIAIADQQVADAQIAFQAASERRDAARIARRGERASRRETAGLKVEQQATRLRAQLDVARLPIGELRPNRYSAAERRAAERSRRAVASRDFEGALQSKRDQLYNHFAYRAAREAQSQVKTIRARAKRIMNPKHLNKVEGGGGIEFRRHIVTLATQSGFVRPSKRPKDRPSGAEAIAAAAFENQNIAEPAAAVPVEPTDKSLAAFVEDLINVDGLSMSFDPDLVAQAMAVGSFNFMSLDEVAEIDRAIVNLDHIATEANKIRLGNIVADFHEVRDLMVGQIRRVHGFPDVLEPGETRPHKPRGFTDNWTRGVEYGHAWLVKIESFAVYLDGGVEGGPNWQFFGKLSRDAQFEEHQLKQDWGQDVQAIFSVYSRAEKMAMDYAGYEIAVPEVGRSFTRSQMLAVALNMGNAYNRDALKDGYGWNDDQLRAIVGHLEERDIAVVEGVWSMLQKRWPMIKEHEVRMSGVQPSQVEPDQFTLANGRVLAGGYYPLKADTDVNERAFQQDENTKVNALFGGQYASAQTRHSQTMERRGWGDKEVLLDLTVMYQHMNDVAHDVAQRKFVVDAIKLIQDPEYSQAIKDVAGTEMLRTMKEWVHNIAGDAFDPMNPVSRLMKKTRIGANVAIIGFSMTTLAQQPFALINAGAKAGWANTARAVGAFINHPFKQYEFIVERSQEIPTRAKTRDREIADLTSQLKPDALLSSAQQWGYFAIAWTDVVTASVAWSAAYSQGMNDLFSGDEQAAIDYADRVVVLTQGAGAPKDLPRIQFDTKGGELLKQATVFHTFFNAQYNFIAEQRARRGFGQISRTEMLNGFFWALVIAPILINLMLGRHPEFNDPEEEWLSWGAWSVGGNLVASVPIGSQVGRLAQHPGRGFSLSPSDGVIENTVNAVRALGDVREEGLVESGVIGHSVEALAMWKGIPGYIQGKRLITALSESIGGEDVPIRRPLFGSKK